MSFGYGGEPVLRDLDLTVPAGTSMAVVGVNGAGKTTLAKLLCRLYDPQEGAIEVDGVDLRDLDLDDYRAGVTAVFQDFVRYELPLRDNVAPRRRDRRGGDRRARRGRGDPAGDAGHRAGARVRRRHRPLRRPVAAGRAGPGAGRRTRQGARLVLLDEPTAALDVRGEAEIFERILAETATARRSSSRTGSPPSAGPTASASSSTAGSSSSAATTS